MPVPKQHIRKKSMPNFVTLFYRQAGRQAGRQLFLILFFIILFKIDAHADTTTGLVGWWRMEEGSGTTSVFTTAP